MHTHYDVPTDVNATVDYFADRFLSKLQLNSKCVNVEYQDDGTVAAKRTAVTEHVTCMILYLDHVGCNVVSKQ